MAAADYWSQAQLDPAYLASHGGNRQAIIQAILGYGSSSALAPEMAAQYGIDPGAIGAANQNPYSVQANLAQTLSGNRYGITNNANAHGALYSGAHAAAQAHETQNAGQRNYNAQQDLTSRIAGIGQNDTTSLTNAYTNIANQALNTPVPQAAPVAPAAAPAPAGPAMNGLGTPYIDPGARENVVQPPKVKLPPLPKIKQATGYQGHA